MTSLLKYALLALAGLAALRTPLAAQTTSNGGAKTAKAGGQFVEFAGQTNSSDAAKTNAGPKIQFDAIEFNFGKAAAGEPVTHTYIVSNTGTETLLISSVKPSCGCTTAGTFTHEVPPGQSGEIPISFNSTHYSGTVAKFITVDSNAKNMPRASLRLTGTVWKPIDIEPPSANFNIPADLTSPATTTVRIVNGTEVPLILSNVVSSTKKFTAELKESKPGKEFEMVITAHPPFEPGNINGAITFNTSRAATPTLSISVMAYCRESIQIFPPKVTVTPAPSQWITNKINVSNSDFPGFQITNAVCSDERILVSLHQYQPAHGFYNLSIAVPPNYQQTNTTPLEITLYSNHPRHPQFQIPVSVHPQAQVARSAFTGSATAVPVSAAHP